MLKLLNFSCSRCSFPSDHSDHFLVNINTCNSLVRSSGRYGEYYRACRARGMGHGRALKAVARKRLRAIYAVMRDRVPYRE